MTIVAIAPEHWDAVKIIYEQGIATGDATFQTSSPGWEEWNAGHLPHSRLVAVENGEVIGWAALSAVSGRCVYAGVAEVSVYVAVGHRGKKVGEPLLKALIDESERHGIWTLQAGIFPENIASLTIHGHCGFRRVGYREKIGKMWTGVWRDTVLMERRSRTAGVD